MAVVMIGWVLEKFWDEHVFVCVCGCFSYITKEYLMDSIETFYICFFYQTQGLVRFRRYSYLSFQLYGHFRGFSQIFILIRDCFERILASIQLFPYFISHLQFVEIAMFCRLKNKRNTNWKDLTTLSSFSYSNILFKYSGAFIFSTFVLILSLSLEVHEKEVSTVVRYLKQNW